MEIAISNLSLFYRQVLNKIITCSLPNGLTIVRAGKSTAGLHELDLLLTLITYAAVNSADREKFVGQIVSLDQSMQQEMAERIQKTEDYLIPAEPLTGPETFASISEVKEVLDVMQQRLGAVVQQRDITQRQLNETVQERDQVAQNTIGTGPNQPVPESPGRQNTYTELAEAKQKIRLMRQEITDKEELAEMSATEAAVYQEREREAREELQRLRQQLSQARSNQDEIDELRTKAEQLTRAQQESNRLREKLADLAFYKARVEELQRDNGTLYETRASLETEIAANRIRMTGMAEQAVEMGRLREQVNDLEEQNLELHQLVQELQEQLRRAKSTTGDSPLDRSAGHAEISIMEETDKLHVPENIQLRNENQRLRTLNAALQEQQGNQKSRVGELEHQIHKLRGDNKALREDALMSKNNLMDMETFARESLNSGANVEDIIERLKSRDDAERARLDEKVWEARIRDAFEKIETLENENTELKSTQGDEIEHLRATNDTVNQRYDQERKRWEKEVFARDDQIHEIEKKLRETERNFDKLCMENEQQVLEAEQHSRSEQRRLQLETEIDHLRRRNDHSQEVVETREKEIEKLERELEKAMTTRRAAESELRQLRDHKTSNLDESSSTIAQLETEHKRLQMELKKVLRKEEMQEREKENALTESINLRERNSALSIEIGEKNRIIKNSRSAEQERVHLTRDFELQKTMLDKLQQQLVDEKVQSQNLIADAKAARKRAEKLQRIEMENEEYRTRVRQLERENAEKTDTTNHVQEGVGELKSHLITLQNQIREKDDENNSLRHQLGVLEGMLF